MIELKCCTRCGETKNKHDFPRDVSMSGGRSSACRQCRNLANRELRARNRKPSRPRDMERTTETFREQVARELCSVVQTYWHIGETNPRFGVAMIGGGYV